MDYSVEIFKNIHDETIFIVPHGFDQSGVRRNVNKPAVLKGPYDAELIGLKLKECFNVIVNHNYSPEDMNVWVTTLVTGIKSEKKFIKNHISQKAYFNPDKGYEFKPRSRKQNNQGYKSEPTVLKLYDVNAMEAEIGEGIIQTFTLCK